MGFGASVKSAFANWRDFSGRSLRSEYWYFVLFIALCDLPLGILQGAVGVFSASGAAFLGLLSLVFGLIVVVPHLAVGVRRLHDTDHSGWSLAWLAGIFLTAVIFLKVNVVVGALLVVVAIISEIVVLVWLCNRGTEAPNNFGPPSGATISFPAPE